MRSATANAWFAASTALSSSGQRFKRATSSIQVFDPTCAARCRRGSDAMRVPGTNRRPINLFQDLAITDANILMVSFNDLTALSRAWLLQFEAVPNRQTQYGRDYNYSCTHCGAYFFVAVLIAVRALGFPVAFIFGAFLPALERLAATRCLPFPSLRFAASTRASFAFRSACCSRLLRPTCMECSALKIKSRRKTQRLIARR
jgi:hypothetical protein